jgi:hypothetical protein
MPEGFNEPVDATPPLPPPVPTQVRYPWRSTIRSVFQFLVGLCALVPLLLNASGVEQQGGAVAVALTVSGAVTKIMALPQVEDFLESHIPWLAAKPAAG